jgi:ubiquinone/menaquinone biosynthesis C-methylase UbiE
MRTDSVWKSSEVASVYLEGVRGAIPLAQQQIDVMVRLITAGERPVRSFLDLGCGDGILAAAILGRFPDSRAVFADFSEAMLQAARKRVHSPSAEFLLIDYGVPSWTESVAKLAPFDAIVSGFSIHHQPDNRKREVYAEIFALLAPSGVFVNVEHVSSASPWVASIHDELFVDHLAWHHAGRDRTELAAEYYNRPDKAANILAPVEDQCRWLHEIGFTDVDCYFKIFELAIFGGRKT